MSVPTGSTFADVLKSEKLLIAERRSRLNGGGSHDKPERVEANPRGSGTQDNLCLTGLALSGGGIRSAAFCLGVLQALYQGKILGIFDYLSTVSGGGYIGAYLTAWISTLKPGERVDWVGKSVADHTGQSRPPAISSETAIERKALGNLANVANRMLTPIAFLSRHLPGWLAIGILVTSGVLTLGSLVALLIRSLDGRNSIPYLAVLGFPTDISRAFVPSCLLFVCLLFSLLISNLLRLFERKANVFSSTLYALLVMSIAVGFISLLAMENVDVDAVLESFGLPADSQSVVQDIRRYITATLISALTVGLLPALMPKRLLESGQAKKSPLQRRVYNVATFTALFGVPLFVMWLVAHENISGHNEYRERPWEICYNHVRDWGAFSRLLLSHGSRDYRVGVTLPGDSCRDNLATKIAIAIGKLARDKNHRLTLEKLAIERKFGGSGSHHEVGTHLLREFLILHEEWKRRLSYFRNWRNQFRHLGYLVGFGDRFTEELEFERRYRSSKEFIVDAINRFVLTDEKLYHSINDWEWLSGQMIPKTDIQYAESVVQMLSTIRGSVVLPDEQIDQKLALARGLSQPLRDDAVRDLNVRRAVRDTGREHNHQLQKANWELIMMAFSDSWKIESIPVQNIRSTSLFFGAREVFAWMVQEADQATRFRIFVFAASVFLIGVFCITMNPILLQGLYRDSLSNMWLAPHGYAATALLLKDLNTTSRGGPYHLINSSVNLLDTSFTGGKSQTGNFLFSANFVGGTTVGYAETEDYFRGKLTVADAVGLSGAAVSPVASVSLFGRVVMYLLNMRLGRWLPKPGAVISDLAFPSLARLSWEWLVRRPRERAFQFITDGGHNENLGVGALLQRRCRFIVACDAGHDPKFLFEDLLKLQSECERKFGIQLKPLVDSADAKGSSDSKMQSEDLAGLAMKWNDEEGERRRYQTCAKRAVQVFKIIYPEDPAAGHDRPTSGLLIYVKLTVPEGAPWGLRESIRGDSCFPHDSTADQFFDDIRFLQYVELGRHNGGAAVDVIREHAEIARKVYSNRRRMDRDEDSVERVVHLVAKAFPESFSEN